MNNDNEFNTPRKPSEFKTYKEYADYACNYFDERWKQREKKRLEDMDKYLWYNWPEYKQKD